MIAMKHRPDHAKEILEDTDRWLAAEGEQASKPESLDVPEPLR